MWQSSSRGHCTSLSHRGILGHLPIYHCRPCRHSPCFPSCSQHNLPRPNFSLPTCGVWYFYEAIALYCRQFLPAAPQRIARSSICPFFFFFLLSPSFEKKDINNKLTLENWCSDVRDENLEILMRSAVCLLSAVCLQYPN